MLTPAPSFEDGPPPVLAVEELPPGPVIAVYGRISKTDNVAGVKRQIEAGFKRVAQLDAEATPIAYVDNDLSASKYSRKPRPAYLAMVAAIRAGRCGMIVAYKTDRLYRRPRDLEDLLDLADAGLLRRIDLTDTGELIDPRTSQGERGPAPRGHRLGEGD